MLERRFANGKWWRLSPFVVNGRGTRIGVGVTVGVFNFETGGVVVVVVVAEATLLLTGVDFLRKRAFNKLLLLFRLDPLSVEMTSFSQKVTLNFFDDVEQLGDPGPLVLNDRGVPDESSEDELTSAEVSPLSSSAVGKGGSGL